MTKFSISAGDALQNMSAEYHLGWDDRQRIDNVKSRVTMYTVDMLDEIRRLHVANKILVDKLNIVERALNQIDAERDAAEMKILAETERLVEVVEGLANIAGRALEGKKNEG